MYLSFFFSLSPLRTYIRTYLSAINYVLRIPRQMASPERVYSTIITLALNGEELSYYSQIYKLDSRVHSPASIPQRNASLALG